MVRVKLPPFILFLFTLYNKFYVRSKFYRCMFLLEGTIPILKFCGKLKLNIHLYYFRHV